MKLVFYDVDRNVVEIIEDVQSPIIDDDNIEWENGKMTGVKLSFHLLDDDVIVDEKVTDKLIALDRSNEFTKVDLLEENKRLNERIETNALAFMEFVEMMLGGGE